jgi:hypothetical protein
LSAMNDLRLDLSHISARLREFAMLLEGGHDQMEVAHMLRELALEVDQLRPPLSEASR